MFYSQRNSDRRRLNGLIASVIMILVFSGCGRKGPPVAPGVPELSPVAGLSYEIEEGFVRLSWDKSGRENESILTGYVVHRSVTGIDEETCRGCPVLFERIKELGPESTSYGELLETGKRYIYKVVAVSKYGSVSPDSPFIEFEF